MHNKNIRVSVRTDLINKADDTARARTGTGWSNVEITVDQLIKHICCGHPYTHQFAGGKRSKDHFTCAEILIADIDKGLRLDQALEHSLISKFATFIHTTPTHTSENHRFRVIFVLERKVFGADQYEAMYQALMEELPTDPKAKSAAQFFFGSTGCDIHWIGKSIPDKQISSMIAAGIRRKIDQVNPPISDILTPQTCVMVKNGNLAPLNTLAAKTSIHCPFGTHPDKSASAFVKISNKGDHGVECRSCGHSAWSESPKLRNRESGIFDQLVHQYAGRENSTFQYKGLAEYDHDIETSLGKSNFHITKMRQFKIREIIPGIHLIKSPKGTGKTHALSLLTDALKNPTIRKKHDLKDDRTILIGHCQSLIRESAQKLGLDCYLDTAQFDTKISRLHDFNGRLVKTVSHKPQHYAICLDSLAGRVRLQHEKYSVVIIDESEQVFSHFLSDHMKNPSGNFDILSRILKSAKFVYCLDADLDQVTLTGVVSALSYDKDRGRTASRPESFQQLFFHLNEYKPPERNIQVFASKNQLESDLRLSLKAGLRCFVTSNSRKLVTGLYELFKKTYPDKQFQLIVADSGDDFQIQAFLREIKTEILNVDAVLSSPSIGTGIDITFPNDAVHVDAVYGFFESRVNTHFDADQQLARVRHPGVVKVWLSPALNSMPVSIDKIRHHLMYEKTISGLNYYLDSQGVHASLGEHPFIDLLSTVVSQRHRSMNNFKDNFIQYKTDNGWSVTSVEQDESQVQIGSAINKASTFLRKQATQTRLLEAPDLSFRQVSQLDEKIKKNHPLTAEQKAGLQKYWLSKFYAQEVTAELISFDQEGKFRDRILLFEAVINPLIKHTNFSEITERPDFLMGVKPQIKPNALKQVVFLRQLFEAAGIYDFNTYGFRLDAIYGTPSLRDFINFIKHHTNRFEMVFQKKINSHIDDRPAHQVNSLLKLVGLQQIAVRKNKGSSKGTATFKIDPMAYKMLTSIVERRRSSDQSRKSDKNQHDD
jgi:hypothetical protein